MSVQLVEVALFPVAGLQAALADGIPRGHATCWSIMPSYAVSRQIRPTDPIDRILRIRRNPTKQENQS